MAEKILLDLKIPNIINEGEEVEVFAIYKKDGGVRFRLGKAGVYGLMAFGALYTIGVWREGS